MKLNEKILVSLLLMFTLIIAGILAFGFSLYLDAYRKLDERDTISSIQGAVSSLNASRDNQIRILNDWAPWDETYDFISDPEHSSYIGHNLLPQTFRNLDLDLFVITDLNGSIIWGRMYDRANATLRPLPVSRAPTVQ